jgi:rRNA maturation protein Nop10
MCNVTVKFICPRCGGEAIACEGLESCGVFTGNAVCQTCGQKAAWQDGCGCWQAGHQYPYEDYDDRGFLDAARIAIGELGCYWDKS